jgi:hypothetical protein
MAKSTRVERLSDSLISVPRGNQAFPSQVGQKRFHFKLNVGRQ